MTVGRQISEALRAHAPGMARAAIGQRVVELLRQVQLPDPERMRDRYPHELSGGMRQRIVVAMAIANAPKLIIADEPTTALDVTVQAQVLQLLKEIGARPGSSLVLITHDFGVVAEATDRVAVMYYGRVVETGPVERLFARPGHPYTRDLLASIPRVDRRIDHFRAIAGAPPRPGEIRQGCAFADRCAQIRDRTICRDATPELRGIGAGRQSACHFAEELLAAVSPEVPEQDAPRVVAPRGEGEAPVLVARDLHVVYGAPGSKGAVAAVRGVDVVLREGGSLGIVGESGCGKSTLLRALLHLPPPRSGVVALDGTVLGDMDPARLRRARQQVQMVQQDPATALDRRMPVLAAVREALEIHGIGSRAGQEARAREYLSRVGIGPAFADRLPGMLSGGATAARGDRARPGAAPAGAVAGRGVLRARSFGPRPGAEPAG